MNPMLILLPVVATLVSFLHYFIGLTGYGIFMPTMMAVTFLSMGVLEGLVLFGLILVISLVSNAILKKFRLHFWPARAINLAFIGIGVSSLSDWVYRQYSLNLSNIYGVMIMILLVEEFVHTQLVKSKGEAKRLILGTLVLAIIGAEVMSIAGIQNWVLAHPYLIILLIVIANIIIGNYRGMRLIEIGRFGKAIRR
ncbi:MAG TPA: 7TM domain-containing protein [Candidatus Woesebacteria bacterium]|nr:7TM domain-containing protein [Candidatus Woesebacteria bacterium]HRS23073.1 7TM domain-containing protein [Candidatus Woesebacteria bacterium]